MNESHAPLFKGIWIPVEILKHPDLSDSQKFLWSLIDLLGRKSSPCWASNEWLAAERKCAVQTVKNDICYLKKLGLIEDVGSDGKRLLVAFSEPGKRTCISTGRTYKSTGRTFISTERPPPNIVEKQELKWNGIDPTIKNLHSELCRIFVRDPSTRWNNDDEHMLLEIAKRPGVMDEMAIIEKFKKTSSYPPQSIPTVLRKWDQFLDYARNGKKKKYSPNI